MTQQDPNRSAQEWARFLQGVPQAERKASYAQYLESPAWRTKRLEALERAENRCQLCNRDGKLQVHHRTYERIGDERPEDLTVLCAGCHKRFHNKTVQRKRSKQPTKTYQEVASLLQTLPVGTEFATADIGAIVPNRSGGVGNALARLEREGKIMRLSKKRWRKGRPTVTLASVEEMAKAMGAEVRLDDDHIAAIQREAA